MPDLIVDTHILHKIIESYNSSIEFQEIKNRDLPEAVLEAINHLIYHEGNIGFVVASTLAFIEIANQFNKIANNKFSFEKFKAFVNQPPSWFLIEPISVRCILNLTYINPYVQKRDALVPVEINDAIHGATAITRDPFNSCLATKDGSLKNLEIFKDRIRN